MRKFLSNFFRGIPGITGLLNAVTGGRLFRNLNTGVQNLFKGVTGSGLTDAQLQSEAITDERLQRQMDFQQQMRDSQYQATVADMQKAGVNPALAISGSINAAPSGASSPAAGAGNPSFDFVGLIGQMMQLSLLKAQRSDLLAGVRLKESERSLNEARADESRANTRLQSLVSQYYPSLTESEIRHINSQVADAWASANLKGAQIADVNASVSLKHAQEVVARLEADWLPKIRQAEERNLAASAAQSFAQAAYQTYVTDFARRHGGQLPGFNAWLGVAAAVEDALQSAGIPSIEYDESVIDWREVFHRPFGPLRNLYRFGKTIHFKSGGR